MQNELDNDLILVMGLQVMKGFLYFMSGVVIPYYWISTASPQVSPVYHNPVLQVVWGVVEVMSCIFALIPTRRSRITLTIIILLPGITLLFVMLMSIFYWIALQGFVGLSLYYLLAFLASPVLALTSSLYMHVTVFVTLIQVLLLWHYYKPVVSAW